MMRYDDFRLNPALRPTVMVHAVAETVYRPGERQAPPARPDAIERIARETNRAA